MLRRALRRAARQCSTAPGSPTALELGRATEVQESLPPQWLDQRSREYLNDHHNWARPRPRHHCVELRNFDAEAAEDPELYKRTLAEDNVSAGSVIGAVGGDELLSVDVDGKVRVRSVREQHKALKDHLVEVGARRALSKQAGATEGSRGEGCELSSGEWFALQKASAFADATDAELLAVVQSQDRVMQLSHTYSRACGALKEERYDVALTELDKVLPFLGDWYEGDRQLKWQGVRTLAPGTTLAELEGQFFATRAQCWLGMRNTRQAMSDMTLAVDLLAPLHQPSDVTEEVNDAALISDRVGSTLLALYRARGELQLRMADARRALVDADAMLALEPDELSAYELKMRAEEALGDHDAALETERVLAAAEKRTAGVRSDALAVLQEVTDPKQRFAVPHPDAPIHPHQRVHLRDHGAEVAAIRRRRDVLKGRRMKALT